MQEEEASETAENRKLWSQFTQNRMSILPFCLKLFLNNNKKKYAKILFQAHSMLVLCCSPLKQHLQVLQNRNYDILGHTFVLFRPPDFSSTLLNF